MMRDVRNPYRVERIFSLRVFKIGLFIAFFSCMLCEIASSQPTRDEVQIFVSEGFEGTSGLSPECMRNEGWEGCYVAELMITEGYGASYEPAFMQELPPPVQQNLTISEGERAYSVVVPGGGAIIQVWNLETGRVVLQSHQLPPEESGQRLYYTVNVRERRQQIDLPPVQRNVRRERVLLHRQTRQETESPPVVEEASSSQTSVDISSETIGWSEADGDFTLSIDSAPQIKGGIEAILEAIRYPPEARFSGVSGEVIVELVIDENGDVVQSEVIEGLGAGTDEEALRVVEAIEFRPAMVNGSPVRVKHRLLILFQTEM
jgi:TonB family protein